MSTSGEKYFTSLLPNRLEEEKRHRTTINGENVSSFEEDISVCSRPSFSNGDSIEARFMRGDEWFPGTVNDCNADGTYSVYYNFCDETEESVRECHIRSRKEAITKSEVHESQIKSLTPSTSFAEFYSLSMITDGDKMASSTRSSATKDTDKGVEDARQMVDSRNSVFVAKELKSFSRKSALNVAPNSNTVPPLSPILDSTTSCNVMIDLITKQLSYQQDLHAKYSDAQQVIRTLEKELVSKSLREKELKVRIVELEQQQLQLNAYMAWNLLKSPENLRDHDNLSMVLTEYGVTSADDLGYCGSGAISRISANLKEAQKERFLKLLRFQLQTKCLGLNKNEDSE